MAGVDDDEDENDVDGGGGWWYDVLYCSQSHCSDKKMKNRRTKNV